MYKICTGCKQEKQFEEYGKDKNAKDGLNQKCKECCRKRDKNRNRSEKSIEKIKEYKSEWQKKNRKLLNERLRQRYAENIEESRSQARERAVRYRKTKEYQSKKNEYDRKYRKVNPEKARAKDKIKHAIKTGKLIRSPICQICQKKCDTHGHHKDYSKPLDVIWLCPTCHISYHRNYEIRAERLSEETPSGDAKV